jgi:hypothetical protein
MLGRVHPHAPLAGSGVGPGRQHAVVMGLVAVAVEQHDVAGRYHRLPDDLVGRRGPVRDEVGVPGALCLGR